MNRKLPFIVGLICFAAVTAAAAQQNPPGSGWTTGMQFQNVGGGTADIRLYLYTPDGSPIDCGARTAAPFASVNYLTDVHCGALPGFGGSAVVESTEPLRGIVHINNADTGQAGGIYNGTTLGEVSNTLLFPLVKHNHFGRTTSLYIQNASDTPANLTATFIVNGSTFSKSYLNVPPNAMVVATPADAGVPAGNGQVGSLTVTGNQPLAGTVLEHEQAAAVAENLQAAKAFTPADYDDKFYCPLFRNDHGSSHITTGAQVQNVSSMAQTVTLVYKPRDGGGTVTKSLNVQPGASVTFYAPFFGVPAGSVGSVTITGAGNILAVVNDKGTQGGLDRTTTYACFPAKKATNEVVLPLYKEYWKGNMTGIQIQNVSETGSVANIELTYLATNNGANVTVETGSPVAAGSSTTFFGVSDQIFPTNMVVVSGNPADLDSTYGAVIISSNTPIVAIANESGFGPGASLQDSKNYEGFNQ